MIDLTGKVVLVTGASRGIGAATARVSGRAGADVVLHYGKSGRAAQQVAGEIGSTRSCLVEGDLAVPGVASDIWSRSLAWRGRIDILVNNAAVFLNAGVDEAPDVWADAWRETLQVNLIAVADLCREALRHFRSRGGGTIINIASRAAFRGDDPPHMHYAASKAGVVALTKSIARGFGRSGVLAYCVAPGWVRTDMASAAIESLGEEQLARDIPSGALASAEEVANVVAFLASGLAPQATGTTVDINGASYVR
jgi:3-oxoacyl-[acyl-carrier protein] reductase